MLVSDCAGPSPAWTGQWSLPRAPSQDGKGGHHGRQGPGGRQVTTGPPQAELGDRQGLCPPGGILQPP